MEQKGFRRKLTAILSADVAGYSRLMQDDEAATVKLIFDSFKIKVLRFQRVVDAKRVCGTTHLAL